MTPFTNEVEAFLSQPPPRTPDAAIRRAALRVKPYRLYRTVGPLFLILGGIMGMAFQWTFGAMETKEGRPVFPLFFPAVVPMAGFGGIGIVFMGLAVYSRREVGRMLSGGRLAARGWIVAVRTNARRHVARKSWMSTSDLAQVDVRFDTGDGVMREAVCRLFQPDIPRLETWQASEAEVRVLYIPDRSGGEVRVLLPDLWVTPSTEGRS